MPLFNPIAAFNQSFTLGFSGAGTQLVSNTTAEASILPPSATGSRTIPANWLMQGRTIRIILNGVYTQPLVAGTMTIRVKVGGTTIASGTTGSLLSLATAAGFRLSTTFTAPSAGTAVALLAGGTMDYQASAFTRQFLDVPSSGATIDTTKTNDIDVSIQMSVGSGASVKTNTATVEFLSAQTVS
jgi:hypothetical protein